MPFGENAEAFLNSRLSQTWQVSQHLLEWIARMFAE